MKINGTESNKGLVTCVRLSKDTRNRLARLGNKDQTFDDIVNVMIDENLQGTPCDVKKPKLVLVGESGDNSL